MTRAPIQPSGGVASTFAGALRNRALEVLAEVLQGATQVALLDVPNHANPGDAAIFLGELSLLDALGIEVVYTADQRSYEPGRLRRAAPSAPILLHGGGNLGDAYPRHQLLREHVVAEFPDRAIVQLPQSVFFGDQRAARASLTRLGAHGELTLLVRDRLSVERLAPFALKPRLCPDSAFGLGYLDLAPPTTPTGALLRRDRERLVWDGRPLSVPVADWLAPRRRERVMRNASRGLSFALGATSTGKALEGASQRLLVGCARRRFDAASCVVGPYATVITDRLHGVIVGLLAGRRVVALPSLTGKVASFVDTWCPPNGMVAVAPDLRSALAAAEGGWT